MPVVVVKLWSFVEMSATHPFSYVVVVGRRKLAGKNDMSLSLLSL